MQIQINSDKAVVIDMHFARKAALNLARALDRFEPRLTRVEVHLSDLNSSDKGGASDKRCVLEARPARQKPVSVEADGATIDQALRSATGKLRRLLATHFDKTASKARRTPKPTAEQTAVEALPKVSVQTGRSKATKSEPRKRKTPSPAKPAPEGRSPKTKPVHRARRKAHPTKKAV